MTKEYCANISALPDPWTVSEWVEQHTAVLADKLRELAGMATKLTGRTVWPRRPV